MEVNTSEKQGFIEFGMAKQNISGDSGAKYQPVADQLNISSLYGYKLSSKLAASVLGEYRTSVLNYTDSIGNKFSSFNNPGYLILELV